MLKKFTLFAALIAFCGSAAAAENESCYNTFYKTKDMDCLEAVVENIHNSAAGWAEDPQTMPGAVSGFLAEIFSNYPEEKQDILQEDASTQVAGIYLMALLRAGLIDDAREYAAKTGLTEGFEKAENIGVPTLKEIKPSVNAADNDLLIGAYSASGNTEYITAILDNYNSVKESMASDAFRIALVTSKFGPTLAPEGRESTMASAACKKYKCETNVKKFQHVLTLASAFWATRAISRQDKEVKTKMLEFFNDNPELKKLLMIEQKAFGNYLTMLIAYAGTKDNPHINSSLSIYENLGSAQKAADAIKPLMAKKAEE